MKFVINGEEIEQVPLKTPKNDVEIIIKDNYENLKNWSDKIVDISYDKKIYTVIVNDVIKLNKSETQINGKLLYTQPVI